MCSYICSPWCAQVPLTHPLPSGTTKVTKSIPGGMQGSKTLSNGIIVIC